METTGSIITAHAYTQAARYEFSKSMETVNK
jgi:hypothetical protein